MSNGKNKNSKISQMINLNKPEPLNVNIVYSTNNWENYESINLILDAETTISQLKEISIEKFKNDFFFDDIENKDLVVMLFKKKTKKPNYDYPVCDPESLIQDFSKTNFCIVEKINDKENQIEQMETEEKTIENNHVCQRNLCHIY